VTYEIVLGPPGTGKTTTLIGLVESELERGVPPDRIGYISFTRRAADEARDRAQERFKLTARQLPWFRTIHSLCFYALGLSSGDVLEGKKLKEFGDWLGVRVSGKGVSMEEGTTFGFDIGDRCLHMENLARVKGITLRQQYAEDSDELPWPLVERVGRGLEEYKRKKGIYDFTDMLKMFVDTEWATSLEVLLVDEAQDLSALQWAVVQHLAKSARRVVIAGDDDQAIYKWAGAAVDHFVALPGDERVLAQSWRVPPAIQDVALEVLRRVKNRRPKIWRPREGDEGVVSRVQSLDELDFASGEEIMVLARNTCFLRDDAMKLMRSQGIMYSFRGATAVRQSLINAILDWERLRRGEKITVSQAEKIYAEMEAGSGYARGSKKLPSFQEREAEVGMAELKESGGLQADTIWHEAMEKVSPEDRVYMLKALRRGDKLLREPSVRLSTIHGSKGGQADHVVILRDVAWRTFKEKAMDPESEARTWYVAATRAKKRLTIVAPQTRRERAYDI
jgi:DNA helicase-2/ATP-dependent DNA helicase PcrA